MRHFFKKSSSVFLPIALLASLFFMHCEPGKALDIVQQPVDTTKVTTGPKTPSGDTTHIPKIVVKVAPNSISPTDTALVQIQVSDASDSTKFKTLPSGSKIMIIPGRFSILATNSSKAFSIDSIPVDGVVSFRIASSSPGVDSIYVEVTSGGVVKHISFKVIVTEKPVTPIVKATLPKKLTVNDTATVKFQILDSAKQNPLPNATVSLSSSLFSVYTLNAKDTIIANTSDGDGMVTFRVLGKEPGTAGTILVRVKTAAGIILNSPFTLKVDSEAGVDRPRKMVFTADRSTLRADGSDSTLLKVLVKDDNNNPLEGENITFTSTGGLVEAKAITDKWGLASATLRSERVNHSVTVTATLVKTGATSTQSVAFDGITINVSPAKRILMVGNLDPVLFELKDGAGVPMSGDSLEIVVKGADKGFAQAGKDSMIIVTDTKGQYKTFITSSVASDGILITARALGAKSVDTVTYTSNTMTLTASKASILGDGIDASTITATLKNGAGANLDGKELRWTTTFGTFGSAPFSTTSGGTSSITLKSAKGSGLAVINVEAYTKNDDGSRTLLASGNVTIPIKSLKVSKLVLKVTPDNIAVKIGETKLVAQAYDSAGNVMTGLLVGFRLVKGAGGGDEVITPPVDYTKSGQAEATLKAGGVISSYQGVKLTAMALDIVGSDTLVIAASDTVGLTVSGPPNRVSVGCNITKGLNDNDGTYALPCAAVVTDVNGNLVADGTPTNFSTTPIASWHKGFTYHFTGNGYGNSWITDTVFYELPWGDYNNNGKLDAGEVASRFNSSRPARGEDRDGNGYINVPPEKFDDWNGNGIWDHGADVEPEFTYYLSTDTLYKYPIISFIDWNKNGLRDTIESYTDLNHDGKCECTGQFDVNGNLYEESYSGNTANHPAPGEAAVGVTRQVETVSGKALNKIVYVQSMARFVSVRLTAESNGIRSTVDIYLPVILDK